MSSKAHYEITNFVGMWWQEDTQRWIPSSSESLNGCTSHRYMKQNSKEAWKHYREMGLGFVLLKIFVEGGKRLMQEWMHYPTEAQEICSKCRKCKGRHSQDRVCMKCWRKILPFLKNRENRHEYRLLHLHRPLCKMQSTEKASRHTKTNLPE